MQARILVVDDDPLIRGSLCEVLKEQGYEAEMAANGADAMTHLQRSQFDLILTDWKMPQVDGLSLLEHVRAHYPDLLVILMTGYGNVSSAVDAVRRGAFDYLSKPVQAEELQATLARALNQRYTQQRELHEKVEDPFEGVIGKDPSMQEVFRLVRKIANAPTTVLLEGESGTGKRVIAQAIHRADERRRNKPFVEVSCGAIPDTLLESELFGHVKGAFTGAIRDKQGRFEVADGGTILLDEIDAFSKNLQVKLLRVIQDRLYERVGDAKTMKVDVRVIAATNRNLLDLIQKGKFREDLYYRLNVITLRLPPLRERKQDLPLLVQHFVDAAARSVGLHISGVSPEALEVLVRYPWPGNVREMQNILERTVILADNEEIQVSDLPEAIRRDPSRVILSSSMAPDPVGPVNASSQAASSDADEDQPETPSDGAGPVDASSPASGTDLKDAMRQPEREMILRVLEEVRWNRSAAAKKLGIHRSTLYQKLKQLGIQR